MYMCLCLYMYIDIEIVCIYIHIYIYIYSPCLIVLGARANGLWPRQTRRLSPHPCGPERAAFDYYYYY